MPDYTVDGLVSQVRRRSAMPESQNLFTDATLIDMLNDEFVAKILPFVVSFHEEYYLTFVDYAADSTTKEYDIPAAAIGNKLKDVQVWRNGYMLSSLPRLSPSELSWGFQGYYLQGNKIVLYPDALGTGNTIRMQYYKRPNSLVANSAGAKVNGVTNTPPNTILGSASIPATITNGVIVDVVESTPPFRVIGTRTVGSVTPSDITIPTLSGVATTNYVCLTGETISPEIPAECYVLLAQAVVVRCLEAIADVGGLQIATSIYESMKADIQNLLTPRVENEPKRIYLPNSLRRYV